MATRKKQAKTQKDSLLWDIATLWNRVAMKENRPLEKRDYIYASELGMPFVDRYLKMRGVPYTNPPNDRSLRKFLAGNIWEYVVKSILISCGVFKHDEVKSDSPDSSLMLSVHGRLDFMAGGTVDAAAAQKHLETMLLPEYLHKIAHGLIKSLDGVKLQESIVELKSVSTFAFDKIERANAPINNHKMQAYHYQKMTKKQATILYVCKDDCRMKQFWIKRSDVEDLYSDDVAQMTRFYKQKKMPPIEPLLLFSNEVASFEKHLGIEYSPYLTRLYGYKTPEEYRDDIQPKVTQWNRVINRYAAIAKGMTTPTGKELKITDSNKEVRKDIESKGFNFDQILARKVEISEEKDLYEN